MEPCGTPREILSRGLDLFFIDTNCFRSVRYDLNQRSSLSFIPYFLSFRNNIWWLQVSKAFFKSQKIEIVCFFAFKASLILLRKWTIGWEVEWSERKPNCHLLRILFASRKEVSLEATIFSRTFENELSILVCNYPCWSHLQL